MTREPADPRRRAPAALGAALGIVLVATGPAGPTTAAIADPVVGSTTAVASAPDGAARPTAPTGSGRPTALNGPGRAAAPEGPDPVAAPEGSGRTTAPDGLGGRTAASDGLVSAAAPAGPIPAAALEEPGPAAAPDGPGGAVARDEPVPATAPDGPVPAAALDDVVAAAASDLPGRAVTFVEAVPGAAATQFLPAAPGEASAPDEPGAPAPPPVTAPVPAGRTPGPAEGLRLPARCPAPASGDGGAGGEPEGPSPAQRLQLAAAHEFATGAGVLVAVIDTGVAAHPRLAGRLRGGGDYLTGGDGLDDCDGHGTAVAGLLAASPSPDDEVVGIAPGATVLSVRQSSPSVAVAGVGGGSRAAGDVTTLAEAVVLAVRAGAGIVNVSEAVCLSPERAAGEGPGLQAALRFAAESDVVVVAAAGNAGTGQCDEPDGSGSWTGQVSLPGWYDDVVTVGAVGPDDAPAEFTVGGPWVDLAAPGTGMRSLAVDGGVAAAPLAGTSFSAPWVAGLAALLRERFPRMTAAQVVERMTATTRRPAGGRDAALGAGVVDPVAALTSLGAASAPPPAPAGTPGPVLPGTTPTAPPPGPPPVDAALVLLLAAAALAATLLRRAAGRAR